MGALDLDRGIVAVLAGRDRPRWADAPEFAIPAEFVDTQLIGHLHPDDANDYLQQAGVADAAMRAALIRYAEVEPAQVHPLYLGLCADIVLTARERGDTLTAGGLRRGAANRRQRQATDYPAAELLRGGCGQGGEGAGRRPCFR